MTDQSSWDRIRPDTTIKERLTVQKLRLKIETVNFRHAEPFRRFTRPELYNQLL